MAGVSKLRRTSELGAEFWNDSCSPAELTEAIASGATGATSNPVIVAGLVKADRARYEPVLAGLFRDFPHATEDELAWRLIEEMAREGARLLEPIHRATEGRQGYLSIQVNPQFYRDPERMLEHGRKLARLAPNIAIKAPCTPAGIQALEELSAEGITVNATVCFTLAQALAAAEAIERGAKRAGAPAPSPHVTLMVGRLDDHLGRVFAREGVAVDPGTVHWAGIAVFKRMVEEFRKRGLRARPLAAAYRHHLHWSELIGPGVTLTIPYTWWKRFEASPREPELTLARPVEPKLVAELLRAFPDFRRAYEPDGLLPAEFGAFGATRHTLEQFLGGYQELLGLVRERLLTAGV